MKISIQRLKDYIPFDQTSEEIASMLTASGLEVEGIEGFESVKGSLEGVVIGEVLTCESHPNADKLRLTTVDIGTGVVPIVCGAPNVAAGQKVAVATVNTTLYTASGESLQIKKSKIRGEVSEGMICAEDELGVGDSHEGIMVLDTDLSNGTPANQLVPIFKTDVLEIGLTPNRADAASHLGVARDLRALLKKDFSLPSVEEFNVDSAENIIDVQVESAVDCPRYAGLTISGIQVGQSPEWLQNYLKALDLEPINCIVDVTNYILHDLGQPLHAFDADKISGGKLIVKKLPKETKFVTLDGKERKLSGEELMICDEQGGLCIGGVLGGLESGISDSTTSIFLESACFSPDVIRKGAQFHGIKTDASFRFERGTDPNMPVYALKRAAMLIKEIAGGQLSSPITDLYPVPVEDFKVPVKYKHIDRLIGKHIPADEIKEILESLEIRVEDEDSVGFTAVVKPYRVDVTREADIIEEILRIYGFESIPLQENYQSDFLASHPEKDANKLQYRVTELLAAQGFHEILTNSLTKAAYTEKSGYLDTSQDVVIINKLSEDLGVLRQTLLFSGLEVLSHNINRRQKDLKCFEFGSVYQKSESEYREEKHLSIYMTGNVTSESWLAPATKVQFPNLHAVVETLFLKLNLGQPAVKMVEQAPFEYGLELFIRDSFVGTLGLLQSPITRLAEVKQDVFFASLNWGLMLELASGIQRFTEISKFPEVRRDLSLVIDREVSFDSLQELSHQIGGPLLKRIGVFDVYKGDKIDASKKAYALSFFLQDNTKTLTDKVIDKTMNRLMLAFEKEVGALIRK
ncbi:phenylalanine--tRNA ligase subunit beta [Lunatibacter salilacus]|uniref:phenylalanine--tRNA ligase subunit beta n=1 Tax=Lunatibacter salilacus TaxID=2483804 RepID=UPI00131D2720|nr:phenylalanine--tRNA ligase subunit beta [Lunatibacter salilacus]